MKLFRLGLLLTALLLVRTAHGQAFIGGLPPATLPLTGTEQTLLNQNNVTKQTTINNITAFPAVPGLVNVRSFGVACNGLTDDYPFFVLALAAVPTGGTLFIPPSTTACMLSQNIVIPRSMTVWAYPGTATLKELTGNTANPALLTVSGINNVTVQGVVFDGGGSAFANTNPVITGFGATQLIFDRVTVQNTRGIGMNLSTLTASGVQNSTFSNVAMNWQTSLSAADRHQAIAFNSAGQKNFALNNYFTNIGLDAVSFTAQTDFVADGNRCKLALATPQYVTLPAAGAYPACVFSSGNTSSTIVNTVSDSAPGNGIDLGTSNTSVVVSNNYVIKSGGAGVAVTATNFQISGNILLNNVQNAADCHLGGVSFADTSTIGVVSNNVATDNQGSKTQQYGIYAFTACSHPATLNNVAIDPNNAVVSNLTGAYGGNVSNVPQLTQNFQGTGQPGMIIGSGTTGGFIMGRIGGTASTDVADVFVTRNANFTGGTAAFVNSAFKASTTTVAGITSYEWTGLFTMDNFGTSTDGSQNLALYTRAIKESTGRTWANTFELDDKSTDPTVTSVTTEFDMFANTTDANNQRVIIDVVGGRIGGTGTTPTIGNGIRIGPASGSSANATFVNGVTFQSSVTTDINVTGGVAASGAVITDSGTHAYGLNLGGTYSAGWGYVRDNSPLIWNSAQSITQQWTSASSCIQFRLSGTAFACLGAAGGTILTPTSGNALTLNGISGSTAAVVNVGGATDSGVDIRGISAGAAVARFDPNSGSQVGFFGVAGASGQFVPNSVAGDFVIRNTGATRWSVDNGTTNNVTIGSSGGIEAGTPTGGDKGTGTVNAASGVFSNNVQLLPVLTGTTGSIGGGSIANGACSTGTVSVTGSTTSMAVSATPTTFPGAGFWWAGYVSTAGTVTVEVCNATGATNTPTASAYNVRVIQ